MTMELDESRLECSFARGTASSRESSDWAFQIYKGTTVEYSSRRFRSHIHRFDLLHEMLGKMDPTAEGRNSYA